MEKIEYFIVIFFVKISKILPTAFIFAIFNAIGTLFFYALKSRRNTSIKNLSFAYPKKTEKEIFALAKSNFQSIAKTVAEIALLFNRKKTTKELLLNENEASEKVRKIVKGNKNGVIFLTAHFGNWEITADFLASIGFPMIVIGREGDNKLIEKNLTKPFRERNGNKNIYKKDAMRNMVKTLKNGGNVGLLIDQKVNKKNGILTKFFQRDCISTTSVASMKLTYDSLVIPIFAIRENGGKFRILLDQTTYKAEEKTDKTDKIQAMTQHYNDIMERAIRKAPEQWFWMHDRWKI